MIIFLEQVLQPRLNAVILYDTFASAIYLFPYKKQCHTLLFFVVNLNPVNSIMRTLVIKLQFGTAKIGD